MANEYRNDKLRCIAYELMSFINVMSEIEALAKKLVNLSRTVRRCIAPLYGDKIRELKIKEVPWNELSQIANSQRHFYVMKDIFRALDAFS